MNVGEGGELQCGDDLDLDQLELLIRVDFLVVCG